jgi:glucose/arabinose dehydrogenase
VTGTATGRRIATAAGLACLLGAVSIAAVGAGAAPGSPTKLELREIGRFEEPTYVTQAPGEPGTIYVVEQAGRVIAVRQGLKVGRPFLDISDRVGFGFEEARSAEAGMLSIAFDPDYQRTGRFYVFYTANSGNNYVDQYRRSGKKAIRADRSSRREVVRILHPWTDSHNGGQLQFGPDGYLWISTGDGGCCDDYHDQARSLGTKLGKLLRIDPRRRKRGFRVPAGNPLIGTPGIDALYSWGLRNPWRFSFDRLTGNLIVADVGDNKHAREEINYLSPAAAASSNFGWPQYEGFRLRDPDRPGPGLEPPVLPIQSYAHHGAKCSITGGYVVRDPSLPQLYGRYVYADFCGGRIRSLAPPELVDGLRPEPVRITDDRDEGLYLRFPTSFGEGLAGEIFVASKAGPVYRLQAKGRGGGQGGNRRSLP